jgi:transposase InsO family protein
MKNRHNRIGLSRLCRLFGISRQAYYQHCWHEEVLTTEQQIILNEVKHIRQDHRAMGTRKLYEKLYPFLLDHQIKMGRDALFDLLAAHKLLVRRTKRTAQTTFSSHWLRKWPNLARNIHPVASNQLWVSDITYWKTSIGFLYVSFITDAYSHKIVGHHVAGSLETLNTIKALQMAISSLTNQKIRPVHHSDRGVQYCSGSYTNLLRANGITISMTENGDPLENALAERINGILKNEYLNYYSIKDLGQAQQALDKAVCLYNEHRPHMSIGMLTPQIVYQNNLVTEKVWKSYQRKIIL